MDIGPLRKNEFYSMTSNMSFVMEKVTRHHHLPFSALFPTVVLEQEQLSNLSITYSVKLVRPVEASGLAEWWGDTEGTLTSASPFIGETRPGTARTHQRFQYSTMSVGNILWRSRIFNVMMGIEFLSIEFNWSYVLQALQAFKSVLVLVLHLRF